MRPDEIFIVLLLVASVVVVAALAIHSRRHQATRRTHDASTPDVSSETASVADRPVEPRRARSKQRR
ncbi:MAG: hypothetical protein U0Q11_17045 [Vicinamibacterales bacterium]